MSHKQAGTSSALQSLGEPGWSSQGAAKGNVGGAKKAMELKGKDREVTTSHTPGSDTPVIRTGIS